MPTVASLERLADLIVLQIRNRLVEFRHEGSRTAPSQIAAVRRRAGVFRRGRGDAGKVLAFLDPLAQLAKLLAHGLVVVQFSRLHQDVAYVDLIDDDRRFAAATLIQFHDVVAARRANRFAHVARFHFDDQVQNELRQLRAFSPAKLPAVQCCLAVRIGDRELAEVLTLAGSCGDILCLVRNFLELLRRGGCRQRQQDVRHVEFIVRRCVLLARKVLFKLMRGNVDMGDDIALPQGAQGQLLAHRFAIYLVIDTLRRQGRRQLIERDFISRGNLLQRAVQLFVGHGQADVLRALHFNFLQDQTIYHLLLEHTLRVQFDPLLLQALLHRRHLNVEFALQDQPVVDDGRNPVEHFAVSADVAGLRMGQGQQQHLRADNRTELGNFTHGSKS
jgi:hypothetical protein